MASLFRSEPNFDFIGKTGIFVALSTLAVTASVVVTGVLGLNYGVDFAGGYEIQVKFPEPVSESQLKELLAPVGVGDARAQRFGPEENNEYLVLIREHGTITEDTKAKMNEAFQALVGGSQNVSVWEVAESGESLRVGFTQPVTEEQVRGVLEPLGLEIKGIAASERTDQPVYDVTFVSLAEQVEQAIRSGLSVTNDAQFVRRVDFRGPQMGKQLRTQGIMAVLYAMVFILLYIAVRFDLFFSPGAVLALLHDVLITVGVFSVLQIEFSLSTIAALLTIVGYSLNDTIVIYDRIRENTVRLRGRELRPLVNTSINQTLSRTLLTSGTTLLVVIALLVVGGGIVRDFAVALLVGIGVGTYSSIAVASPAYIWLRERSERKHGKAKAAPARAA